MPWPTWSRSGWTRPGWPAPRRPARCRDAAAALAGAGVAGAGVAGALASVIFAGPAADVSNVVISGRDVVRDGQHLLVPDVPAALSAAIQPLLSSS